MSRFNDPDSREVKVSDLKLLKGIWPFIKPYFSLLALSVFLIFLVTGMDLMLPYLTKKAIDGFILSKEALKSVEIFFLNVDSYTDLAIIFVGIIVITFFLDFFQSIFMEYTGQKIILNIRTKMFEHMMFLPVSFFDKNSSGRLVSRVTSDIENMNEMFSSILIFVFKDMVMMIAIIVIMFLFDFKFALASIIVVPFVFISIIFFSRISRYAFRVMREKIAEINHSFSENISGIKIIETTGSREHIHEKFDKLNFENFKAGMLQIKVFAVFMPIIELLNLAALAMIILYGGIRVINGDVTIGVLVAFISYMKMFFRPVRELSEKFNLLQNAFASAERIVKILNEEKDKKSLIKNSDKIKTIDSIEFKNIDFSYKEGEPVLKNISFMVEKGESIGIVGHTGAGKSSIINLISGFYSQDSGEILINQKDYNLFPVQDIRSKSALVMQDPILFSGTIRDNLKAYNSDINDKNLKKALINANCSFLFDEKHNGLDTLIYESGRPLSSGEKQLVSIARAFAFNPELIIFDEATSYIDSESEKNVHLAMKNLMKNRTSIMIAHRLSTVREADKILVLKKGEIIESGNHDSLMAEKGDYYNLVQQERLGFK